MLDTPVADKSRVNSAKRLRYARSIGCTSVDGGKWVRWRDRYLREGLELCSEPEPPSPSWQLQLAA